MSQTQTDQALELLPGQKGFWRALYLKMLAALDDGTFMRFQGYSVPGRTFNYRGIKDFMDLLKWVESKADIEDGTPSYRGRIYAGQRGRG